MDIFFTDPNDIPLPPDEVHIRKLSAEPWPDKKRVHVNLEISPFQKRPSGEIILTDSDGEEAAAANFIETMVANMEINLHLREEDTRGTYQIAVSLFYLQEIPESEGENEKLVRPEKIHVDQATFDFEIS